MIVDTPIDDARLIGLSDELEMEARTGVRELHIGWQHEGHRQFQHDPAGALHFAPVVRWYREGQRYRFVPHLEFRQVTLDSRLWRLVGMADRTGYEVDVEALIRRVEAVLLQSPETGAAPGVEAV